MHIQRFLDAIRCNILFYQIKPSVYVYEYVLQALLLEESFQSDLSLFYIYTLEVSMLGILN